MCSCERGEVFTFEDLVFTTAEKTAPNFFPEILIPPRAASSQGPNHWGDAGSGDGGNDGEGYGCCAFKTQAGKIVFPQHGELWSLPGGRPWDRLAL